MGLLGKIKDLFADEEMIEEPVKKEIIKVEIPAPKVEEKVDVTDSAILKKEEKPSPVFFNDNDFEDINIVKDVVKPARSGYLKEKKPEEKKIFRPTPIISPVYGVLDKNYRKDDITTKIKEVKRPSDTREISIDEIRKKAFGTLEEDLEQELFNSNTVLFNEEIDNESTSIESTDIDIFEQMETEVNDEYFPEQTESRTTRSEIYEKSRTEEPVREVTVEKTVKITSNSSIEEDLFNLVDETNEQIEEDLFNLIDSMYEKGDE